MTPNQLAALSLGSIGLLCFLFGCLLWGVERRLAALEKALAPEPASQPQVSGLGSWLEPPPLPLPYLPVFTLPPVPTDQAHRARTRVWRQG